jgi:DNA-binding Lrp family transcriptional regulator
MEHKLMSQLSQVAKYLRRNSDGAGITVSKLARLAKVSPSAVHKRVSDLRNLEGKTIYSNYRMVNGRRTMFYRIAS